MLLPLFASLGFFVYMHILPLSSVFSVQTKNLSYVHVRCSAMLHLKWSYNCV